MLNYLRNRPWTFYSLVALSSVLIGIEAGSIAVGYVVTAVLLFTLKLLNDLVL